MKTKVSMLGANVIKAAVVATLGLSGAASATTYNWNQTAAGSYDWNVPANWVENSSFPNAIGDVANLNSNVAGAGALTVNLQEDITVGTLTIGDSDGTNGFAIASGTGSSKLIFHSAGAGSSAVINVGTLLHPVNTISAPVQLNSPLQINLSATSTANGQGLTFTGPVNAGTNNITVAGGYSSSSGALPVLAPAFHGDLSGSGVLTLNSGGSTSILGSKSFTGKVVANSGVINNGTNPNGSLNLIQNGSISAASELVINGFLRSNGNNLEQIGGSVNVGNAPSPAEANNPGQRLPTSKVTLNGGSLFLRGQPALSGVANTWQQGLEVVQDNVATLDFSSGHSSIFVVRATNTSGTLLNVTTGVTRTENGTGHLVFTGATSGANATQIKSANGASLLEGGYSSGVSVTPTATNLPIVPWLVARASAGNFFRGAATLVTYDANGFRPLVNASETVSLATAGTYDNAIYSGGTTVTSSKQVSAVLGTTASALTINKGVTLTIGSGALIMTGDAADVLVGAAGTGDATLNFGNAEAVIYTTQVADAATAAPTPGTSTIIAPIISGSGGLTKAGIGTLYLTGANTFTGKTHVNGGNLSVGDGSTSSKLGNGDVHVSDGAGLFLNSASATVGTSIATIDDSATLYLHMNGLLNGKLNVANGIETVGGLVLGSDVMPAGYYGSQTADALYGSTLGFESLAITSSPALDAYFSGNGLIQVVPEPAMIGMLGLLAMGSLRRRRQAVN